MKLLILLAASLLSSPTFAQKNSSGQIRSGEAGYKIGCSAAAAANIPSCGEMPSGKKFMSDDKKKEESSKKQSTSSSDKKSNK